MKKPGIPVISPQVDSRVREVLEPLRETVQVITGSRGGKIAKLDSSASTSAIISKINEIIDRLQ